MNQMKRKKERRTEMGKHRRYLGEIMQKLEEVIIKNTHLLIIYKSRIGINMERAYEGIW